MASIKITNARQYIENENACIFINWEGEYVYQDMCGYRTYKTLAGLNRFLVKNAKMRGNKPVTVID